jgi:tetrahydromethanopterin S-methyltransferase subunit G
MKVIADDEEDTTIILGGSDCDNYTKDEYLSWCYGIVQARKDSNKEQEKEFSNKLLCALKSFCLTEIDNMADSVKETETLKNEGYSDDKIPSMIYTPEDIAVMKGEIEEIWNSIDPEEDNYIQKVNIVSVQCENVFTYHVKNKIDPDNREANNKKLDDIDYKNYNITKNALSVVPAYSGYLIKDDFGICFLISIEPLFVSHILDAFFEHNIWFLGFSTRFLKIDGNRWNSPYAFTTHDIGHAQNSFAYIYRSDTTLPTCYQSIYSSNNNTKQGYELIRDFYNYCKEKNKKGSKELIALQIAIFFAIHEFGFYSDCREWFGDSSDANFKEDLTNKLISDDYRFFNKNDLFGILPKKRVRDPASTDPSKKEELVTNYLKNEVIENFVNTYTSWQKERGISPPTRPIEKGGRKTKRVRSKKTMKKRRKSRRSRK